MSRDIAQEIYNFLADEAEKRYPDHFPAPIMNTYVSRRGNVFICFHEKFCESEITIHRNGNTEVYNLDDDEDRNRYIFMILALKKQILDIASGRKKYAK